MIGISAPAVAEPAADDQRAQRPDGAAIVLTDVVKRYGRTAAVAGLSLTIQPGEVLGLLGPNGSGKTTTVNMLCGLVPPTSGRIEVYGHDVVRHPASVRPLLGTVPQETALYEELSAWRNLMFHSQLYGVPRRERRDRVEQMLRLVGLFERRDSQVKSLSGGMKRRLAIARALLHGPQVLYLDEPTLGVDVVSRRAIWDHIRQLRAERKTVVLTTNYLEEASELCDRGAIVNKGQLVAHDTPTALRRRFGTSVLEVTVTPQPTGQLCEQVRAVDGVVSAATAGDDLIVTYTDGVADPAELLNLVLGSGRMTHLTQRMTTLDEVFLRLTGNWDAEPDG